MIQPAPPPNRRVFVYVDGFNLYYRRLQNEPGLKWLCIKTLAERLCAQVGRVELVRFFTAKVDPESEPPSAKQRRQITYWEALRHSGVDVVEGIIESPERDCKGAGCNRRIRIRSEKMSDVNLALHAYRDYLEQSPDVIYILSGDCDVLPCLKMIREASQKIKKPVMRMVCLPTDEDGMLFSRLPNHYQIARTVKLGQSDIRLSPLPDKIEIRPGLWVERPDVWRPAPEPVQ
jgi:uncharacterized LabA/DUF88 family protein